MYFLKVLSWKLRKCHPQLEKAQKLKILSLPTQRAHLAFKPSFMKKEKKKKKRIKYNFTFLTADTGFKDEPIGKVKLSVINSGPLVTGSPACMECKSHFTEMTVYRVPAAA